jgi:type IV pilus assembly protein PilB
MPAINNLPVAPDDTLAARIGSHLPAVREFGFSIPDQRLAAAALALGILSSSQLQIIGAEQSTTRLEERLKEGALLSSTQLLELRAAAAGMQVVDLSSVRPDNELLGLIPSQLASKHTAVPFGRHEQNLLVAIANPSDLPGQQNIIQRLSADGLTVSFYLAQEKQLLKMIEGRYTNLEELMLESDSVEEEEDSWELDGDEIDKTMAVKLFESIFASAVHQRASDVHFEVDQSGSGMQIRYRTDGVLQHAQTIQESHRRGLVSVLKQRLGMDITKSRTGQSGRGRLKIDGRRIDLRGESLPVVYGRGDNEDIVVRLLDQGTLELDLLAMGMLPDTLERYRKGFNRSQGAIVITGPTGSGKSSTLYATLKELASESKKLMTIEDPVEYQIEGVRQQQINDDIAGRDFASALRHVMRADPDIIMVGEVRDQETATTAMNAAQTGHLLLTTLHTNEAAEAPIRLIEMGVPAWVVAPSLSVVVAQRLVRRLCEHCRQPHTPELEELCEFGLSSEQAQALLADPNLRLFTHNSGGCHECTIGYQGRTALQEVLLIGAEERAIILDETRRSADALRAAGRSRGMRLMSEDGLQKALLGWTDLSELRRVVVLGEE